MNPKETHMDTAIDSTPPRLLEPEEAVMGVIGGDMLQVALPECFDVGSLGYEVADSWSWSSSFAMALN